jgi:hypothetical protein
MSDDKDRKEELTEDDLRKACGAKSRPDVAEPTPFDESDPQAPRPPARRNAGASQIKPG